jgi:NAD(P)-dependent dehydrogenase (short-subunit alcohol dehydrogenase family)
MLPLKDKTVLVIGRGSGIARAIALAVSEDGGRVVAAGLHPDDLADAYRGMGTGIEQVDVTDESSIGALAALTQRVPDRGSPSRSTAASTSSRQKDQSDMHAIHYQHADTDSLEHRRRQQVAPARQP